MPRASRTTSRCAEALPARRSRRASAGTSNASAGVLDRAPGAPPRRIARSTSSRSWRGCPAATAPRPRGARGERRRERRAERPSTGPSEAVVTDGRTSASRARIGPLPPWPGRRGPSPGRRAAGRSRRAARHRRDRAPRRAARRAGDPGATRTSAPTWKPAWSRCDAAPGPRVADGEDAHRHGQHQQEGGARVAKRAARQLAGAERRHEAAPPRRRALDQLGQQRHDAKRHHATGQQPDCRAWRRAAGRVRACPGRNGSAARRTGAVATTRARPPPAGRCRCPRRWPIPAVSPRATLPCTVARTARRAERRQGERQQADERPRRPRPRRRRRVTSARSSGRCRPAVRSR